MKEKTLRDKADRIGYALRRGCTLTDGNISLDCEGNPIRGYMLSDLIKGMSVAGASNGSVYSASLEEIEECLKQLYIEQGRKW